MAQKITWFASVNSDEPGNPAGPRPLSGPLCLSATPSSSTLHARAEDAQATSQPASKNSGWDEL